MAAPVVDFFYGIGSRYSYLASTQIDALQQRCGCVVRWRPLYSGDLSDRRGANPFRGDPVSGQYDWDYRQRDAERWAAYYRVPFMEPTDAMKFDRTVHRRLTHACIAALQSDTGVAFNRAMFAAIFAEGRQLVDDAAILAVAAEAGCDVAALRERLNTPETAAAHEATLVEAIERGVFGVPSFLVGDALFWGNDRLELLVHHLTG